MAEIKHGLCEHPFYNRWNSMIGRCFRESSPEYENYGKRGITVYKEWVDNPAPYIEYISKLKGFSKSNSYIDRIDNDGNYEPGNLRWTTQSKQNTNQRVRVDNTSLYAGVYFDKRFNLWTARVAYKGKRVSLKYHNTKEEALNVRNKYIEDNFLPHKIQIFKG